jgi:hypothetical protein
MPITIGTASGNKDLTEVYVGTSSGNKQVTEIWVGTASGNKQVFSAETVSLSNVSVFATGGGSQTATYSLEFDGDVISITTDFGSVDEGDWVTPKSAAGSTNTYQVLATVTSGSLSSGTAGTWLALSTTRSWTKTQASAGSSECVLTIQIRKGTGSVLTSATITLSAESLDFGGF